MEHNKANNGVVYYLKTEVCDEDYERENSEQRCFKCHVHNEAVRNVAYVIVRGQTTSLYGKVTKRHVAAAVGSPEALCNSIRVGAIRQQAISHDVWSAFAKTRR